jgi:ubiquitin-conjugating enzyme E2 J1
VLWKFLQVSANVSPPCEFRLSIYFPAPANHSISLAALPRSREWVCPRCNRSNLECLPDPPQPSNPSISESVSEVKTSLEAEVVPTAPADVTPHQPPESDVSVSVREATPDDVDGTPRSESEDATSVVVSPPATTATPSQNLSGVQGASPAAGPSASFHPSQTYTAARPPMLLDTAICVLLVLVFALLLRRIF